MNEFEALIQRRELLVEKISNMEYEIYKIDQRASLLHRKKIENVDVSQSLNGLVNKVSIFIPTICHRI